MKTIPYSFQQNLPIQDEADVVVVGAGPAGLGAAVAAARGGARTVLIEAYGFPGGMATAGEVMPFMANHTRLKPLDHTIYREWVHAMRRYVPEPDRAYDPDLADNISRSFSKEMAILAAEDLLLAAGVKIYYHHQLFSVCVKDRRVDAAVVFSKSGLSAICGRFFIDATGDGDLAVRAGCEFEMGNEQGDCQPMTLCFKLSGIDPARMPDKKSINELYDAARARGDLRCPRENVLFFPTDDPTLVHFNTTRVVKKNATDGRALSEAEIEGRRQLREFLDFFRAKVPGMEHARIHSMGAQIGIRESRRIRGLQSVGVEVFERAQKFPDGIARMSYPIDIHNPTGSGTILRRLPKDEWYEIPYGCLVAKDRENLFLAGRAVSVDHALHSSLRVMPIACSIGQAAGTAAAICRAENKSPADLDGAALKKRLEREDARLAWTGMESDSEASKRSPQKGAS